MTFLNTRPFGSLLLLVIIILTSSCRKSTDPTIIPPSEFSKNQREILGEKIQIAIAFDDENFPVLPNIPPYDTTVYWFVQTLYNQVTNSLRIDNQSPSDDRWDATKEWPITILDLPEKNAFILPGGNLYLTTGLLKALESDHELYYFLSFEALLMSERYLLTRLIGDFNTNILSNISNGQPSPNGTTSNTLATAISRIDFTPDIVQELDGLVAELICESSRMDRFGLERILNIADDDWVWMTTRTNYSDRIEYLQQQTNSGLDCGSFQTNGGYQNYVLKHLQ